MLQFINNAFVTSLFDVKSKSCQVFFCEVVPNKGNFAA